MTTSYATLEIEKTGSTATLRMNRPDVFNVFNEALMADLCAACIALDSDPTVRVVVSAGRGRNFSAGTDLNWMQRDSVSSQDDNLKDARQLAQVRHLLTNLSKPTIARVQGLALGGGTGLAAACDMAVATPEAFFAPSEVRFGIIPSVIGPYVLRAIGPRHALRYFQSTERISTERALLIGLVNEVLPTERLDESITTLVNESMLGAPKAQKAAKDLIEAMRERPMDAQLQGEAAQRIARQRTTPEAKGGIGAFLEKRPVPWLP